MNEDENKCLTCYDSGEIVTELGPVSCPDCGGSPGAVGDWQQTERRLRDIEQRYTGAPHVDTDLAWTMFELRRARSALMRILTRCQDAPIDDPLAAEIRFYVHDATGIYRRTQ
jgi:hypothetical protein